VQTIWAEDKSPALSLPSESRRIHRGRRYPAFLTAARTSSAVGSDSPFWATTFPSTETVNSPRPPFTTCTSTPGSFFKAVAKLAACSRIEPQTGHSRITTFFIADAPFVCRGRTRSPLYRYCSRRAGGSGGMIRFRGGERPKEYVSGVWRCQDAAVKLARVGNCCHEP
jgi:hypothetical protein